MLARLAKARLTERLASRTSAATQDATLLELIPIASPDLVKPDWLEPLATPIEQACSTGGLRFVGGAPPQHGKTELILHGFCRLAIKHPGLKHAYVTYSQDRSEYVSRKFQGIAAELGLEPRGNLSGVTLKGGTEIRFTSIGGSLTGWTVNGLMLIDDPHKDRSDAESPTLRRKAVDWFTDVARSRRHPRTSIGCIATRWHPEDLSGELISRGYEYINLKALAEGQTGRDGRVESDPLRRFPGEALAPQLKPASFFDEEREDEYTWSSLYQGEPRGRGSTVFGYPDVADESRFYQDIPPKARFCIGADFAYTAKTYAHYSVAVVIAQHLGCYYLVDVVRVQEEPRKFRERIRALSQTHGATVAVYAAATEQGGVEFIREANVPIDGMSANKAGDKFTRAIRAATAWNTGKILLPKSAPWMDQFLAEVTAFTGVADKHDDQVDALAAAVDWFGPLGGATVPAQPGQPQSRWAGSTGRGFG